MTPWTVARQVPLSMGFSRQEYSSGLPFPPSGDLPDPGIKPRPSALQAEALSSEAPAMKKPSRLREELEEGSGGRHGAGREASAKSAGEILNFHLYVKFWCFAHRGFFASFFYFLKNQYLVPESPGALLHLALVPPWFQPRKRSPSKWGHGH